MGKTRGLFSRTVESFGQKAAYDVLKSLFGGAVIALLSGVWMYLKHQTVDFWGLAALGAVVCVIYLALPHLHKNPEVPVPADPLPPPTPAMHAEGLLNPLQVEALTLAKLMREFLSTLGPRPDAVWGAASTAEELERKLVERFEIQAPFEARLVNGYRLLFSDKVKNIMLRLGAEGVNDNHKLQGYIDDVHHEGHVENAAQTLEGLAIEMNRTEVYDPERDTRHKIDQLTGAGLLRLRSKTQSLTEWLNGKLERVPKSR